MFPSVLLLIIRRYYSVSTSCCMYRVKKIKLTKWAEQVQDRLKWKDIVEKTKTLRVVAT